MDHICKQYYEMISSHHEGATAVAMMEKKKELLRQSGYHRLSDLQDMCRLLRLVTISPISSSISSKTETIP